MLSFSQWFCNKNVEFDAAYRRSEAEREMCIDTNSFLIFGIPPYLLFAMVGFLFAFSFYLLNLGLAARNINKHAVVLLGSLAGLLLGSYIFGFLTKFLIALYEKSGFDNFFSSGAGIVFYGGLTGLVLSYLGLEKLVFKKYDLTVLNIFANAIPLFHAFSRVGCFFAGCCYGKEVDSIISVNYILRGETESHVRIPVQLIEAVVNTIIFVLLFILLLKKTNKNLLQIYLLVYPVCRFFLEFLRDDPDRGVFGFISFSQIYSVLILFAVLIWHKIKKRDKAEILHDGNLCAKCNN